MCLTTRGLQMMRSRTGMQDSQNVSSESDEESSCERSPDGGKYLPSGGGQEKENKEKDSVDMKA
jgi:hypothetical protein